MDEQRPIDWLNLLDSKKVEVIMKNGNTIVGVFKAFDYNLNLLLENSEEICIDKRTKLDKVLLRGSNIIGVYESKV